MRQALAVAALLVITSQAGPTAAQTARATAYAQVGKSCVPETRRLCPTLDPAISQLRNQAICLKPYRNSLSLSCRRAVAAATR